VGAVYKFTAVKTGVDANVTITAITGGISLTDIDGGSGFTRALQPVLSVPANKNGYVELNIEFFLTGTSTPSIQTEVPVTPIDVDGAVYSGLPLYEYDEIEMPNGYTYFQWAGTELTMTLNSKWAKGKNNTAVDYPGIDTVQKSVMFTTVNSNISSFKLRVGADNQSGTNASRLRSLYFQKFNYPFTIVLPNRTLLHFSGTEKNEKIELKGTLSASHTYERIVVERSANGTSFEQIGEVPITNGGSSEFPFTFLDLHPNNGANFYRLKLINTAQGIFEVSNTLLVKTSTDDLNGLKLYNTMLNAGDPEVTLQSKQDGDLGLEVVDMSGRRVFSKNTKLSKGVNVIDLSNFNAGRGYFILVAHTGQETMSQKIIIQ
jgi:Secretion system C-terminal sorting domain